MDDLLGRLGSGPDLWSAFQGLCRLGHRFAGTEEEAAARALIVERLRAYGLDVHLVPCPFTAWRAEEVRLEVADEAGAPPFHQLALVRSALTPPEGLIAPLLDLGRGAPEDFERQGAQIPGRIVMVQGEYPFSTTGIHRRQKFLMALERGAVGFLFVSWVPGGFPVTGSTRPEGSPVPAMGISREDAARLAAVARRGGRIRMVVRGRTAPAETANVVADIPGRAEDPRIVVSAHYDGHDGIQAALDNASGVAVALELARVLTPTAGRCARGVRFCFFTVEEWGLVGSRVYAEQLPPAERDAIELNLNLDTVAGSPTLSFVVNGFDDLGRFVEQALGAADGGWSVNRLVAKNSDHVNFLVWGIPSIRVVAGVDEPESNVRYMLTPGDTEDRVTPGELARAARLAGQLLLASREAPRPIARRRSLEEARRLLDFPYGFGGGAAPAEKSRRRDSGLT